MTPEGLRAWREARGLSRREAADVLGVNKGTLRDELRRKLAA